MTRALVLTLALGCAPHLSTGGAPDWTGQLLDDGTPQTARAAYATMSRRYASLPPEVAAAGDVLFFDLDSDGADCGNHAGVVEQVDPDGRVVFREARGGQVHRSYLHPWDPLLRRDAGGRVLNTFLRAKRPDDPPAARYFAAELLCAVVRVED